MTLPTPRAEGYAMPAEWEPHQATWVSWPKDPNTFPADIIREVEGTYLQMVVALAEGEEVRILVNDDKAEGRVRSLLKSRSNVTFYQIDTVDVWVRDYAPICVAGPGKVAQTKWEFNAWGEKYDDLLPDGEAGGRIAESMDMQVFKPGMILEGGSVDVNGRGTLLTTEQCLLNKNRNPGMTKRMIAWRLREYLGGRHVIWLGSGLEGDDTDGHIDDVARFVNHETIALAWEPDRSDRNHFVMEENLRRLRNSLDQDGELFDFVTIPLPPALNSSEGRLPASHLNFYIGNAAVLVPTFDSPTDRNAMASLAPYFPGRKMVGIDCRALVHGLGSIHCVTQQVPKKRPAV